MHSDILKQIMLTIGLLITMRSSVQGQVWRIACSAHALHVQDNFDILNAFTGICFKLAPDAFELGVEGAASFFA